jgi:hypothetical protein
MRHGWFKMHQRIANRYLMTLAKDRIEGRGR